MDDLLGIFLSFSYSFDRPYPANTKESVKRIDRALYQIKNGTIVTEDSDYLKRLVAAMTDEGCSEKDIIHEFELDKFIISEIKLSLDPHPKILTDGTFKRHNVKCTIECAKVVDQTQKFIRMYLNDNEIVPEEMQVDKNRIIFYTFNDKANQFMI